MSVSHKAIAAVALLSLVAVIPAGAASASTDSSFRAAVARILNSIRPQQDFLRSLSNSEFRAFVSCAQAIMDGVATDKKKYVLATSNAAEQRRRFDEVGNAKPVGSTTTFKGRVGAECN